MKAELDHGRPTTSALKHRAHNYERKYGINQDRQNIAHHTVARVEP